MSKDKIEVNMNVYDIPILVEALEEANKEIERLKKLLDIEKNKRKQFDKDNQRLHSIIKEVRELREKISKLYYEDGFDLDTPMLLKYIDEILDKVEEE